MLSRDQLLTIMPFARTRIDQFIEPLNAAMVEFMIDTPARQAAFIAQIAHESGELRYTRELASGAAYEGRADLGNTHPGDGIAFKGRGLIQITGRANYRACGAALGMDIESEPQLLEQPDLACRSAAWWWQAHGLNALADKGYFVRITKTINGGTNGLAMRQVYYTQAQQVLT